jgi:membrane fusion protein (multidrug efflux system)
MTSIKFLQIQLLGAFLLFLASCGGGETMSGDVAALKLKKDSLRELKNGIATQINEIEDQLKLLDTNGNHNVPIVSAETVEMNRFQHFFKVQGVVETDQNATMNAEVAAKITQIRIKEGDHVNKGQVMIELDDRVLLNNIEELKTQIELANTVYEKQKNLWDQNIGSEIQYLEAKTNKESLERKLQTLYSQAEYYKITAPFDGIVDEIFPKVGEMAAPGAPLMRVMNLSKVYLKADVSENYLGKIQVGDTSLISFPSINYSVKTRITRIGRFINPNNRTFKVRFELDNSDERLIPNLLAVVDILDYASEEKRVVISTKLLQETPQGDEFVYVLSENGSSRAKKVMVKSGLSYKGNVEILEGLNSGDKIITKGARGIKDGEIVELAMKS